MDGESGRSVACTLVKLLPFLTLPWVVLCARIKRIYNPSLSLMLWILWFSYTLRFAVKKSHDGENYREKIGFERKRRAGINVKKCVPFFFSLSFCGTFFTTKLWWHSKITGEIFFSGHTTFFFQEYRHTDKKLDLKPNTVYLKRFKRYYKKEKKNTLVFFLPWDQEFLMSAR